LAGDHRADRTGGRDHRDERGVRPGVHADVRAGVDRLLRRPLPGGKERRVDAKSALEQRVSPLVVGLAERVVLAVHVRQDGAHDVVDEEGLHPRVGLARLRGDLDREPLGAVDPGLRHPSQGGQAIEHLVSPGERRLVVQHGIEVGRRLDHPGEERGLRERELRGRLVEVVAGGRADAVDAVPEVDLVQVQLEDLVLGVPLLELDGQRGLLELALERLRVRADHGVLHELLRDRRAALHDLAGDQVGDDRPKHRGNVQGAVLVELVVLDRQDGLLRDRGDLLELDDLAVLIEIDPRQDRPVRRVDRRALGEVRDARERRPGRLQPVVQGVGPESYRAEHRQQQQRHETRGEPDDQGEQQRDERLPGETKRRSPGGDGWGRRRRGRGAHEIWRKDTPRYLRVRWDPMLRAALRFSSLALALCALAGAPAASAQTAPSSATPSVVVAKVDGSIDRTLAGYLTDQIAQAERMGAALVVQLDTAGTLDQDAVALARRVLRASVPVIVWVGPAPAKAQGAGLLLLYASSLAAVGPGVGVGPLEPLDLIDARQAELPPPAEIRSLAASWAAERNKPVPELPTSELTAQQALDQGIAQVAAASIPDLLDRI